MESVSNFLGTLDNVCVEGNLPDKPKEKHGSEFKENLSKRLPFCVTTYKLSKT